jgi:hypothetical protein
MAGWPFVAARGQSGGRAALVVAVFFVEDFGFPGGVRYAFVRYGDVGVG